MICLVTFIVRIGTLICSSISSFSNLSTFPEVYWIVRGSQIFLHLIVFVLCYRYPFKFTKYNCVMLMPTFMANFIYTEEVYNIFGYIVSTFSFFLILCILLNTSWLFTATSIAFSTSGSVIFFIVYLKIYDLTFYGMIIAIACLSIFTCHFFEKTLKI